MLHEVQTINADTETPGSWLYPDSRLIKKVVFYYLFPLWGATVALIWNELRCMQAKR